MAHRRIKISRAPWIRGDGTVSTKKHKYMVTCRSHGELCYMSQKVEGRAAAEHLVDAHRDEHMARHAGAHPNDRRFLETLFGKQDKRDADGHTDGDAPTRKQVKSRPTYDLGGVDAGIRGVASRILANLEK